MKVSIKITLVMLSLLVLQSCSKILKQKEAPLLERKLAYPDSTIYIPYTNFCFIKNASFPNEYGWLLSSKIKPSKSTSVLLIEMNSSDVRGYSGYKYVGGSVQLAIEMPLFKKNMEINLSKTTNLNIRSINNYGGVSAKDVPLEGSFMLDNTDDGIEITGEVLLKTSNPSTRQVIRFNRHSIPTFNYSQFLKRTKTRDKKEEIADEKLVNALVEIMMNDSSSMVPPTVKEKRKPGNGFSLTHSIYGLGSSRGTPSRLIVSIKDSIFYYGIFEKSKEVSYISFSSGDTAWKDKRVFYEVPFREKSKDAILALLVGKEGKYIFHSNPSIMSGAIEQIYIEYEGWCTEFSLKNVHDETGVSIVKILNQYLPDKHQLYVKKKEDWNSSLFEPLIKECSGSENNSYMDVLQKEYEVIKKQ